MGPGGDGPSRCLHRSVAPSSGLVVVCESDARCRIGHYYGDPEAPTWFPLPPGVTTVGKPDVRWRTGLLAEVRAPCGAGCRLVWLLDARRHRLSPAWPRALDVDSRRLLVAVPEGRALVVRQAFAGREVLRLERPWAPGPLEEALRSARFEPDGRLSLTWLRGPERGVVTERVSVPAAPR